MDKSTNKEAMNADYIEKGKLIHASTTKGTVGDGADGECVVAAHTAKAVAIAAAGAGMPKAL
jgi:hypothetical protein